MAVCSLRGKYDVHTRSFHITPVRSSVSEGVILEDDATMADGIWRRR